MMRRDRWSVRTVLLLAVAACNPFGPAAPSDDSNEPANVPPDVTNALNNIPDATVIQWTADGLPQYIIGQMATLPTMGDSLDEVTPVVAAAIPPILKAFRLTTDDLVAQKMNVDDQGSRHIRYAQTHNGLPVIGGDLVVGVDIKGAIFSVNGTARGDISDTLGSHAISDAQALSVLTHDGRFTDMATSVNRQVYIQDADGVMHKAYETTAIGTRGVDPARDLVYVDIDTGVIVADFPQIHFAENRKVYSANNGTTIPGTLQRTEGQAATSDTDVTGAYDGTGDAYEAYKNFWNRDSYDNNGATLISSVHYSQNYCNAYWNGSTQMVYGDGDSSQGCKPLARAIDVTAHELTHAVTQNESNLTYSGESGGMNESNSDIFGCFVEAWVNGGKTGTLTTNTNTWIIGELVFTGGLRFMCNPAQDGNSADYWTSSIKNLDVHYSSGIGNLAFCLASNGGTHPTGKSSTVVPSIGMDKAIRIFYKANVDILTSNSNYKSWRTATEQAATALFDDATRNAMSCAWEAVGVTGGTACTSGGGGSGSGSGSGSAGSGGGSGSGDGVTLLVNGTAVTGIAGAKSNKQYWKVNVPSGKSLKIAISGGTGDADLYTRFGSKPTTTTYDCRPYVTGNTESCSSTTTSAGYTYVMLNGYAKYTGVTLKATY
jgi:vibriolysin